MWSRGLLLSRCALATNNERHYDLGIFRPNRDEVQRIFSYAWSLAYLEHVIAERGVRHGRVVMIPTATAKEPKARKHLHEH